MNLPQQHQATRQAYAGQGPYRCKRHALLRAIWHIVAITSVIAAGSFALGYFVGGPL
jgi:hypothetical protein